MLLWYAYRLDVIAFGSGNTVIAPNCIGSAPGKSCFFDEFVRYIQMTGQTTSAWTGSTTVGTNLEPDVFTTASELDKNGYRNTVDPSKVFPSAYQKTSWTNFSDIFGKLVDNIQQCRQHLQDQGIDNELDSIRRAMVSIHEARKADQADKLILGINKQLSNAGITWTVETRSHTAPDLSTWEEIDVQKTINVHSGMSGQLQNAIISYVANFGTLSKTDAAHAAAIQAAQSFENRLLGDSTC
ncbi:hypothetical protein F5B20DRAFT_588939 [Whalleya microplaca]|nr:hypothetical protein F5B20DRAFT_588939 [Whalleya microplaca]